MQHALAAGLSQDIVDSIGKRRTDRLTHPYSLLHAIIEKTIAWQPLAQDLQARAVAQWGREGLVEIVVLSGFYQMFAAVNQGFDIKAEAPEN